MKCNSLGGNFYEELSVDLCIILSVILSMLPMCVCVCV